MSQFEFKGDADILHLNVRKEGPDDEKALAVDIKLEGKTSGNLCNYFDEKLREFLFTDAVIARASMMEPVGFKNQILNCELQMLDKQFYGVKLHKFKISPVDGGDVRLTFTATFQPNKDDVAIIAEFVSEPVHVVARPQPGLDFEVGGEE